jgi:rare lipoprotein A
MVIALVMSPIPAHATAGKMVHTKSKTSRGPTVMIKTEKLSSLRNERSSANSTFNVGWENIGEASWYGYWHEGRLTCNGERYDPNKLTAAHKTLPVGTILLVTNVKTGKEVTVRINDRGPYHGRRIIDLSRRAANELGFLTDGIAQVKIRILSLPS